MILVIYGVAILMMFILECATHKRIKGFLPMVTIIYLIILMGGNTSNPDTLIYYNIYNSPQFFFKDFGFGLIVQFCNKQLSLTIDQFRMLIAIIGILMMSKVVNSYCKNPIHYYLLYFLYPFMMDVVQVRNFLIMCILMIAINFLLEENKKGIVKYLLAVLVAATIQKTALVYIPLVFIHRIENKKLTRSFIGATAILSLLIGLNSGVVNSIGNYLLNGFSGILSGSAGFLVRNTSYGWIILWGEQICNVILIWWSKRRFERSRHYCENNPGLLKRSYEFTYRYIDLILWTNIYLFCFCPLYVLNINFYRIMRNVMVINLIVFCIVYGIRRSWTRSERILYTCIIVGYGIVMFYINFFYNGQGEYIETIIKSIFTMNWLF